MSVNTNQNTQQIIRKQTLFTLSTYIPKKIQKQAFWESTCIIRLFPIL